MSSKVSKIFFSKTPSKTSIKLNAVSASSFYGHPQYLENDDNYDFGIVKLEKNIGSKTGWAGLVIPEDNELELLNVSVTGYPASKGVWRTFLKKPNYDMYTMEGPITSVKKHKFHYHIDTSGGQSGAGVWTLDKERRLECFGVHVTGSKDEGNGATRITPENFNTISDWISLN
jgi:V8-like Glu-specific endopeptidase